MNCDEVIRELAVPTDDRDPAALAEHLANCPSCASWVKKDAEFRHLWDATRPADPPPQIWDTMWSQIASSLDSATPEGSKAYMPSTLPLNGSLSPLETQFGLSPSSVPISIAKLGSDRPDRSCPGRCDPGSAVAWSWYHSPSKGPTSVDIEAGRWVVIRVEDSAVKVVDLTPDGISYSVDDWLLAFNAAESIANPVVAMKE